MPRSFKRFDIVEGCWSILLNPSPGGGILCHQILKYRHCAVLEVQLSQSELGLILTQFKLTLIHLERSVSEVENCLWFLVL